MSLSSLIPVQYRLVAALVLAGVLTSAGFGAGCKVGSWHADSTHASIDKGYTDKIAADTTQLADKDGQISNLKANIGEQNTRIDGLQSASDAAKLAQEQAELRVAEEQLASAARERRLQKQLTGATTCTQVLKAYWGDAQ